MSLEPSNTASKSKCSASGVLLIDSSQGYAHIGALLFKKKIETKKWPLSFKIGLGLFVLSIITRLVVALIEDPLIDELRPWAWSLDTFFFGFWSLPLLFSSAFRCNTSWKARLLHFDFIVLIASLFSLIASGLRQESSFVFYFSLAWITLEFFEASFWSKHTKKIEPEAWTEKFLVSTQNLFFKYGIAILILGIAIGLSINQIENSLWILLLFFLPYSRILATLVWIRANREEWAPGALNDFLALQKQNFMSFQSIGVLTEPEHELMELWIDTNAGFTKEEVREILSTLVAEKVHPIAQSLRKVLSKIENPMYQVEELREQPQLGMSAVLRDQRGNRVLAHFGNMPWHRILQTELSEDGMSRLKKHFEKTHLCCLLSLNKTVTAIVAFRVKEREGLTECLQALSSFGFQFCALSSASKEIPSPHFLEVAWDLFPIERKMKFSQWYEQRPKHIELRAAWDKKESTGLEIVFDPTRSEDPSLQNDLKKLRGAEIRSNSLLALSSCVQCARLCRRLFVGWPLMMLLFVALLLLSPLMLLPWINLLAFGLCFILARAFALK